jgi:hypothetical protein
MSFHSKKFVFFIGEWMRQAANELITFQLKNLGAKENGMSKIQC